jgi:hypothetical protein
VAGDAVFVSRTNNEDDICWSFHVRREHTPMENASETELSLDHELVFSGPRLNPKHFWITRKPSNPDLQRLKLVSMVHLGIRPAWIAEWTELEVALSNMLAL